MIDEISELLSEKQQLLNGYCYLNTPQRRAWVDDGVGAMAKNLQLLRSKHNTRHAEMPERPWKWRIVAAKTCQLGDLEDVRPGTCF